MTSISKNSLPGLILIISMVAPVFSRGQATAATSAPGPAPTKIAFVNLQEAVVKCKEGEQEAAALQQQFNPKQAVLKTRDDELKKLKDDFQTVGPKLNENERAARARVIQDKQKALERDVADFQSEIQEAQGNAVNSIVKKMLPVLEKYVTDNGYTAVFDISNPQTPVLWVQKGSIITEQLIAVYNAQSASATPMPAPSTPPKPKR